MADYRIDFINKPNRNGPHEHITHVGGPNPDDNGHWKDTVPHVVQTAQVLYEGGQCLGMGRGPDQRSWQQVPTDLR
jgi:hypothetical protein